MNQEALAFGRCNRRNGIYTNTRFKIVYSRKVLVALTKLADQPNERQNDVSLPTLQPSKLRRLRLSPQKATRYVLARFPEVVTTPATRCSFSTSVFRYSGHHLGVTWRIAKRILHEWRWPSPFRWPSPLGSSSTGMYLWFALCGSLACGMCTSTRLA